MIKTQQAVGIEINPKLVGVLFTERVGLTLRLFCYYTNADISQFDVPAEENADNLRALYSKLNMEETCTSLILEEAVQGRVFLKVQEEHWVFTLLKSPGATMPALNADLADLPWQVIWRSQTAEVLQHREPGSPESCYAIRTRISQDDVTRLMQSSKSFTQPVSVPRKTSRRSLYVNVAAGVAGVAILAGAGLAYAFKPAPRPVAARTPAVVARVPAPAPPTTGCYTLFNHRISGPYPAQTIQEMNRAGLLNADTLCRPAGSTVWVKLTDLTHPQT